MKYFSKWRRCKMSIEIKFFASWREEVANRYPQYRHTTPEDDTHVGVIMEIGGIEVWAYIFENSQLYCQVEMSRDLPNKKTKYQEILGLFGVGGFIASRTD